jgi:hypothetical protein
LLSSPVDDCFTAEHGSWIQKWGLTPSSYQAYPEAAAFVALKRRVDARNRFRNLLWDSYLEPVSPGRAAVVRHVPVSRLV